MYRHLVDATLFLVEHSRRDLGESNYNFWRDVSAAMEILSR